MPILLFWYILRDLLKLLVITTVVLVTVISFGAAIKPLGEGVLGPARLLTFIILAMPPMLQFALPFAAAFSATLVYHRMSTDNEIAACAGGGIPYTQLLLPAAMLGVTLTIGLSVLANSISPRFWELMDRAIHLDAAEVLMRSVERGEPMEFGKSLVYAKRIRSVDPPPGSDAYAVLSIQGLLLVQIEGGDMQFSVTGRQAWASLSRRANLTVVDLVVNDPVYIDQAQGLQPQAKSIDRFRLGIPDSFEDRPKFMDVDRLKAVAREPWNYNEVEVEVEKLRDWLTLRRLYLEMQTELRESGRLRLHRVAPDLAGGFITGSEFQLEAATLGALDAEAGTWQAFSRTGSQGCRITEFRNGRPITRIVADRVVVEPNLAAGGEPTLRFILTDATASDLTSSPAQINERPRLVLDGLQPETPVRTMVDELNFDELGEAVTPYRDEAEPRNILARIDEEVRELRGVVLSRLHERAALSVSCVVMMILGGVLGLHLKTSLPLTVYFYSFVPAIGGLILISAGAGLVKNIGMDQIVGLLVMWSGNAAMALGSLAVLWKLSRN